MTALLLQADKLTPVQRAVRDQFQEGGSAAIALLLLAGILALVFIPFWLTRRLNRDEGQRPRLNDPARLYRDWVEKLDLTLEQRRMLHAVARDLSLQQPAKILLSPQLFDRCMNQWGTDERRTGNRTVKDPRERLILQIRAALFPTAS